MSKIFPYGIVEPSKAPEIADNILNEVFNITESLGIHSCLAYGLCLGFIRDGAYISGDNDLDIIVVIDNDKTLPDLYNSLIDNNFTIKQRFPPPMYNTHFVKDNILLDIFPRKAEGFYKEFSEVEYKGTKYPVPHPVDEYLSKCYNNWTEKEEEDGKIGV
jgi:hypothetical protein